MKILERENETLYRTWFKFFFVIDFPGTLDIATVLAPGPVLELEGLQVADAEDPRHYLGRHQWKGPI